MNKAHKALQLLRHRGLLRLGITFLLAACGGPSSAPAEVTAPGQIVAASNLAADAESASAAQAPILLVVTRHDCPYCRLIKQDILRPMLLSGDYEGRVIIRELMIDPEYVLEDLSGQEISSSELASRYDAIFTPTVLLLDATGKEVADRMLGINTTELYGYYLDEAINNALATLRPENAG